MILQQIMNNNGESIPVIFPKCPHDYTYLKFYHGLGYIGKKNWYICNKCNGLVLR